MKTRREKIEKTCHIQNTGKLLPIEDGRDMVYGGGKKNKKNLEAPSQPMRKLTLFVTAKIAGKCLSDMVIYKATVRRWQHHKHTQEEVLWPQHQQL